MAQLALFSDGCCNRSMEEIKTASIEGEQKFTIELPQLGDEVAIGPMHVQAWKESYVTKESGITEEDVDALIGHFATQTEFRKGTLVEALANPAKVLYRVIKNSEGKVVGFFHCEKTESTNEVEGIYLLDEAKGAGIGTKLMNEFLQWSDKSKPTHLEVFSFNRSAIDFYKKLGFVEVEGSTKLYKDRLPFIEMVRKAEEAF